MSIGDPDPYANYAWLRENAPVTEIPSGDQGTTTWLVTSYALAKACLIDPRLSNDTSNATGAVPVPGAADHDLLGTDAPHHTRLRKLASAAFSPRAAEALRPLIERVCLAAVDRLRPHEEADLVAGYTLPVPVEVIHEVLGIPAGEREEPSRCMDLFFRAAFARPQDEAASVELDEYLRRLIEVKRAQPGEDLTSKLLRDLDRGDILHEGELRALLFSVLGAGHTTTIPLLGAAILRLLHDEELLREALADSRLWRLCVEEALRYDSPVQASVSRYATTGMQLGETWIEQGDTVLISLAAANRDPAWFRCPERFEPAREPRPHLAFGQGAHFCLGAPLARVEAEVALQVLFEALPGLLLLRDPEQIPWGWGPMLRGPRELPVALRSLSAGPA
jgi:cytochrome P450